jgi:hypothetical protein
MLNGFTVPLTPNGRSALATSPPWHYSSDCIAIEYWADPAAIAALLPPGLTPDEKRIPYLNRDQLTLVPNSLCRSALFTGLRRSAVYRAWNVASLFWRKAVVPSRMSSVWPRS